MDYALAVAIKALHDEMDASQIPVSTATPLAIVEAATAALRRIRETPAAQAVPATEASA